jgi:hypothetical protein
MTIPAGSYELQDLTDTGIGNLFEGKITLDKTYGHVAYGCATCCGFGSSPWMYYDPIGVGVGLTNNQDVWDEDFLHPDIRVSPRLHSSEQLVHKQSSNRDSEQGSSVWGRNGKHHPFRKRHDHRGKNRPRPCD